MYLMTKIVACAKNLAMVRWTQTSESAYVGTDYKFYIREESKK